MTRRWMNAVLACAALAACAHGLQVDDDPVANTPRGAPVKYHLRGEHLDRSGELYAVDSASLLVRGPRGLAQIAWPRVEWFTANRGGTYDLMPGQVADAAFKQRLAVVSRFPQGLGDSRLRDVLRLLRQDSLQQLR